MTKHEDLTATTFQALMVELQDLRENNSRLQRAATTDALTGLCSRAYMMTELAKWWAAACYTTVSGIEGAMECPFAVVMVDIDHFKSVNDQHGHDVGDEVIQEVARVLRDTVREEDIVGRWGGEEFLIVLPNTSAVRAENLARRVQRTIVAAQIGAGTLRNTITVSVGVSGAGSSNPADSPQDVVKHADEALYRAKGAGRNRVETQFTPMRAS